MNKKKIKEFNCPMCGNPLKENKVGKMRCPFCRTIIIPKFSKLKREESIYVKNEQN